MKIMFCDATQLTAASVVAGSSVLPHVRDAAIADVYGKALRNRGATDVPKVGSAAGMTPSQRVGLFANIPGVRHWKPPV